MCLCVALTIWNAAERLVGKHVVTMRLARCSNLTWASTSAVGWETPASLSQKRPAISGSVRHGPGALGTGMLILHS